MEYFIVIVAILFALMGGGALMSPDIVAKLTDGSANTAGIRNEIRAVYGGFGCAFSVLLLWASLYGAAGMQAGIYFTVAVALAGMGSGRVISAVFEQPPLKSWCYLFAEIAGAAVLFYAAFLAA